MEAKIISGSKTFDKSHDVRNIECKSPLGELQILPGHAHSFLELPKDSTVTLKMDDEIKKFKVQKGVVEIRDNKCLFIVQNAQTI